MNQAQREAIEMVRQTIVDAVSAEIRFLQPELRRVGICASDLDIQLIFEEIADPPPAAQATDLDWLKSLRITPSLEVDG